MIEVLVTGGLACAFCGIWWKSHKRAKAFFNRMAKMDILLDEFMKINDIEYIDFDLYDPADKEMMFRNYIESDVVEWIGKEIEEKGYDFYRMRMPKGYNSLNHRHNFSDEFFYVLSGNICISYEDGVKTCVSEGEYFFVRSKIYHHITAIVDSDIIVIAKPSLIRRK